MRASDIGEVIPAAIAARSPPARSIQVPRIIFQTFKTPRVTTAMAQAARSWSALNPDFEYRFFDDEACRAALEKDFGRRAVATFDALPAGAFRADFWRYCAVAVHGGVYADIDTVCRMPLSRLIGATDGFIAPRGARPWFLYNAFFAATPNHPFLLAVIERAMDVLLRKDRQHPFDVVGSAGWGHAVNAVLARTERAPFGIGRHRFGGRSFRILRKFTRPARLQRLGPASALFRSRVSAGCRTVLWCRYDGYFGDLESLGIDHWLAVCPDPRSLAP